MISENLLQNLIITDTYNNELFKTDHKLLIMTIENSKIIGSKSMAYEKRKGIKKKKI